MPQKTVKASKINRVQKALRFIRQKVDYFVLFS